ncbi:ParB/Sulfiredoxin [Lipomyces orientalis]|uniref:ParB/Sulfiredoxin n=1 Tax=Lipomyces orientalis TaxID=1233043 RepID=A0ACC3TH53_9ASCO
MSIQTSNLNRISFLPLASIRRPIVPVLDEDKIGRMIETLSRTDPEAIDDGLPPIDVLRVRKNGKDWYFGFGGCHRFQAYERTGKQTVKCKIVPVTESMLKMYVGGSVDEMFKDRPADAPTGPGTAVV